MNYQTKFYDFIILYNALLLNLSKRESFYTISINNLKDSFNIKVIDKNLNSIVYQDSFNVTKEEYNYLTLLLGYEFIENHDITLPFFNQINEDDSRLYYSLEINKPLDYDKASVHVLRNSKFEIKLYYFDGLNKVSYEMQDKALEKLNNKTYTKKK